MRSAERGKWKDFYQNDCLIDVRQSVWVLAALMGVLRSRGDGPYYYGWQREFLYAPEDARVLLVTNTERHMDNDALFRLIEKRYGGRA